MLKFVFFTLLVAAVCAQVLGPHRNGGAVTGAVCSSSDQLQQWKRENDRLYVSQGSANYCLNITLGVSNNGAAVQTYMCTSKSGLSEQWKFDGNNRIISALTGKCLTLLYIHGNAYSQVVVADCMPSTGNLPHATQEWTVNGLQIINVATGQCLRSQPPSEVPTDKYTSNPIVIGHRGSTYDAPENTMPAFKLAMEQGADGFESDLRVTKDNVVVLIHDDTVDRTSTCKGKVRGYTYAELLKCDFGTWFSSKFAGTTIPTFEEAVKFASERGAYFVLDLKEMPTPEEESIRALEMKRVLELYDFHSLAIASCRNENQIRWFNGLLNGTALQHLQDQPKGYDNRKFWKTQIQLNKEGFSLNQKTITSDFVRKAHQHLMSVFAWSPDSVQEQLNAIWYQVDGVITGDVQQMVEFLRLYRSGVYKLL